MGSVFYPLFFVHMLISNSSIQHGYPVVHWHTDQHRCTMASNVREIAQSNGFDIHNEKFAQFLDENDELRSCRSEFHYPKNKTLPPGKRSIS